MKKFFTRFLLVGLFLVMTNVLAFAQTTISGKVTDAEGEPLPGANVYIKGTNFGTVSNPDGTFSLTTSNALPLTLQVSFVGFNTQEVEVKEAGEVAVKLEEETMGEGVVVSASRVEENIMKSPVTIEKMDIIAVQQAPTPDFYDGLARLKGVSATPGSLTFNSINTRGFAAIANTRFVQLIDGMDNASPLLNFPTGNVVGISDLDVESVELVPGAASALYGPNAFNGILFMNSKSPFDYQGLSATLKVGTTYSNSAPEGNYYNGSQTAKAQAHNRNPYNNFAIRYAKAINNRFAFKLNFSMLDAQDWRANNYNAFRSDVTNYDNPNNPTMDVNRVGGANNFDGVNTYGDEVPLNVPIGSASTANAIATAFVGNPAFGPTLALLGGNTALAQTFLSNFFQGVGTRLPGGNISLPRIGHKEENLVDNQNARSIKADIALHYRINDNLEAVYNYRYGSGSSVYQGGNRYALRDFGIQFHKLELKGKNFFVRGYMSQTDAGNSYNVDAIGLLLNQRLVQGYFVPNFAGGLVQSYLGNYIQTGALPTAAQIQTIQNAVFSNPDLMPQPGSVRYQNEVETIRTAKFKRGGASFTDNSRLYHAEFNYNFKELVTFMDLQVGGNVRRYDLFSDNTVFNENNGTEIKRITIDEFGGYVQVGKSLLDDRLKFTGSVRYDKNQNFNGQINPRISAVYSLGEKKQHNIRASFQTGFRNPETQAQFIYFPSASGILLGGTRANAEQYGIFQGGSYTDRANPTGSVINLDYIQPEKLQAIEVGYKGIMADNKLMLDFNVYYNDYQNFIAQRTVFARNAGFAPGTGEFAAGTAFRPYTNAQVPIQSWGSGLGLTYRLPKGYTLSGNYSFADFQADLSKDPTFEPGFNTPKHKFNIGVANREVWKNIGFDISYRWQDQFLWQSSFGNGYVSAYGVIDAQVSCKVKEIKSVLKLGANNLLGNDYSASFGGPWIGQLYYFSITFDEFFR